MISSKFFIIFFAIIAISVLFIDALAIKSDVCGNGKAPLAGYFCGRGPNRQDCPSSHHCVISPVDAYAVCCPNIEKREIKTVVDVSEKPGSCPPPNSGIGICIARCTDDSNCPGSQKCCGGCPRQCVPAVSL